MQPRRLKKRPRRGSGNRRGSRQRQGDRNLVPGRSHDRAEEQDHTPLGPTRIEAVCSTRPAHPLRIHLRGIAKLLKAEWTPSMN